MKYYSTTAKFCYRAAFVFAAATYGITVYKILCFRARISENVRGGALSIVSHETVQYLSVSRSSQESPILQVLIIFSALALIWLFMPQWPVALLPYCIYSIFHVLVYIRSDLIPTFKTVMIPALRAKLIHTLETNVVPELKAKLIDKFETNVVPALQSKLQANSDTELPTNLNSTLQTVVQTNINLALQAKLHSVTDAPDTEKMFASDAITNNVLDYAKAHYDCLCLSQSRPLSHSLFPSGSILSFI